MFDIETTSLDASFGIMLSYAIKTWGKDEYLTDIITPTDMKNGTKGDEDARIVRNCIRDLLKHDKIITYYGSRFDFPFLRTRALSGKIPFPEHGTLKHIDLYFTIRGKMKLNSNRLENACRVLLGETDKTRVEPRIWRAAGRGDKKSLQYIYEHNIADVADLEKLYDLVIPFRRKNDASI